MAKEYLRSHRVADSIQRELSVLLRDAVKDPRVGMVTVSGVTVTPDLSVAKIYFTILSGDVKETLKGLEQAAGFLRSRLAKTSTMRSVPTLRFYNDTSTEYGNKMSSLINTALSEDQSRQEANGTFDASSTDDTESSEKG